MPTKKIASTKKVVKTVPKKKGLATKSILAIGASVAAIGGAAYYFFGSKGKKHQKDTKEWMTHMKTDILKKLDKTEKASKKAYHEIVDEVSKAYAKHGKAEVALFAKKLKTQWKSVEKSAVKPAKAAAKKIVKHVTKKK
jgi:hypothetical protein